MKIIEEKPTKTYRRCPICNDGSLLIGNHKNSHLHISNASKIEAKKYGLVKISIPTFNKYCSNWAAGFNKDYNRGFSTYSKEIPLSTYFANVFFLPGIVYDLDSSSSLIFEPYIREEILVETYMELINIAIDCQRKEDAERLPIFEKEIKTYRVFLDIWYKISYDENTKDSPDLEYKKTYLDLEYCALLFPNIRKSIIVVREKHNPSLFNIIDKNYNLYSDYEILRDIFGYEILNKLEKGVKIVRQGDLYLEPIPSDATVDFPNNKAKTTWECSDFAESHKPEMVGLWRDEVVLKGEITHPEHPTINLPSWHRIVEEESFD